MSVSLVEHNDAGRDASAVEEVRGQTNDPLYIALPDEVSADVCLCMAAEEDTVRHDYCTFTGALKQ